ncbi:Origin recognition complex subunit 3 [Balamuthia mandrillaris]
MGDHANNSDGSSNNETSPSLSSSSSSSAAAAASSSSSIATKKRVAKRTKRQRKTTTPLAQPREKEVGSAKTEEETMHSKPTEEKENSQQEQGQEANAASKILQHPRRPKDGPKGEAKLKKSHHSRHFDNAHKPNFGVSRKMKGLDYLPPGSGASTRRPSSSLSSPLKEKRQQPQHFFRALRNEKEEHAICRMRNYHRWVEELHASVENVLSALNQSLASDLYHFINEQGPLTSGACFQQHRFARQLEVPTALLFIGVHVSEHEKLWRQLSDMARLRAETCPSLKKAIKQMVAQFRQLNANTVQAFMVSMKGLQQWYQREEWREHLDHKGEEASSKQQQQDSTAKASSQLNPCLVVIIEDFESFDENVLHDLIAIISQYRETLPIALVLGLATADALYNLNHAALRRLRAKKFDLLSANKCIEQIVYELLIKRKLGGVVLGGNVLSALFDHFHQWRKSITSFTTNLRHALMEHSRTNPLYFLCLGEEMESSNDSGGASLEARFSKCLDRVHLDYVLGLPSVQRLKVKETLSSDDTSTLIQQMVVWLKQLQRYNDNTPTLFECAHSFLSSFTSSLTTSSSSSMLNQQQHTEGETCFSFLLRVYELLMMQPQSLATRRQENVQMHSIPYFVQSVEFGSATKRIKSCALEQLLTFLQKWKSLLAVGKEEGNATSIPTFRPFPMLHQSNSKNDDVEGQEEEDHIATIQYISQRINELITKVQVAIKDGEHKPQTAGTELKRRPVAQLRHATSSERLKSFVAAASQNKGSPLRDAIIDFITEFFTTQAPPYLTFPLHEIVFYDDPVPLQKLLLKQQAMVEGMLEEPHRVWSKQQLHPDPVDETIIWEGLTAADRTIDVKAWFDSYAEEKRSLLRSSAKQQQELKAEEEESAMQETFQQVTEDLFVCGYLAPSRAGANTKMKKSVLGFRPPST